LFSLRNYDLRVVTTTQQSPQAQGGYPVDDVKSQMEGVTRVYIELDNKISDKGGVQNLFGMNRKIRQALESISIGELDSMLAEIHRAKEGLTRLQEDVVEIRVLKEVLSAPMPKQINGQARL
jgi:hypothetical protein